ncbi:MAG: DUF3048 domain-containing protein [Lachnospiraceae bacterium]|nr:DUF3048 domain-containing protein [Lachnospiraceae bacterium]
MRKRGIALMLALAMTVSMLGGCAASPIEEETSEAVAEESEEELITPIPTETPEPTELITPEPEPQEDIPAGMAKSILTGEYVDEAIGTRRPVAFMVDNVSGAFPHYGNSHASVYIEAPVEAELTRECIIYEDYDDLDRIGSLRSCRDYFLSYALGFDTIFCHYGQAAYALVYLENDKVDNISGLKGYAGNYFYRSSDLKAPHNAHTSGKGINDAIEYLGYRKTIKQDFEPTFKFKWVGETADVSNGMEAAYASAGYQSSKSYFEYNPEDGLYYRFQYGGPEIDGMNGEQIKVKNLIFEFENASLYQDSQYVHFDTVGTGKGIYVTDGKAVNITWQRNDYYEPAKYFLEDGTELEMTPGKTFVNLVKNKHVGRCVIGPSKEEAVCAVSEAVQAELENENATWESWFKEHEAELRQELDIDQAASLAAHGGISKCQ